MDYAINTKALPTFFAENDKTDMFSRVHSLKSKPITTLHYHNITEIGICLSGSGQSYIGERIYRYHEGCIQIIPPSVPHYSNSDERADTKWIFISFDAVGVMKNAGIFQADHTSLLANPDNIICGLFDKNEHQELRDAVWSITKSAEKNDAFTDISKSMSIVQFLVASARLRSNDTSTSAVKNTSWKISPALDLIGSSLDDSDALYEENLARICGISVATLRRLFNKNTGYSPKAFIIHSRMAHAEYLLRKSSLSVTEIAEYVGYNEISGFNKTFKAFFGISPLKYRSGKIKQ